MAAHKKKEQIQINLLPERGFEQTTTGRVLAWILSTFRIIVIVTEIIVMTAFLSRFWLDAQNTDLTEELQRKKALLVASQGFEEEFRDVQKRISIFKESTESHEMVSKSLSIIRSYLPPEVFLSRISISQGGIELEGESYTERSLQQLIVNLESTDLFENVAIGEFKTRHNNPLLSQFRINFSFQGLKRG